MMAVLIGLDVAALLLLLAYALEAARGHLQQLRAAPQNTDQQP